MKSGRLNKKIFQWDKALSKDNWYSSLRNVLSDLNLENYMTNNTIVPLEVAKDKIQTRLERDWNHHCMTKDKLRTYRTFKTDMSTASHLNCNLPKFQRSLISQLRLGILPINIETGRYTGTAEQDRLCQMCDQGRVENEAHFVFECDFYTPYRRELEVSIGAGLDNMNNTDRFCKIFKHPYALGRYIENAYRKRREKLYS